MQKKIFFWGKFYFFKKKRWFFGCFSAFYGQRSVTAAWATRSPWSNSNYVLGTLYIIHYTISKKNFNLKGHICFLFLTWSRQMYPELQKPGGNRAKLSSIIASIFSGCPFMCLWFFVFVCGHFFGAGEWSEKMASAMYTPSKFLVH